MGQQPSAAFNTATEPRKNIFVLEDAAITIRQLLTGQRECPDGWLQIEEADQLSVGSPRYSNGIIAAVTLTKSTRSAGVAVMLDKAKFPHLIYPKKLLVVGVLANQDFPGYSLARVYSCGASSQLFSTAPRGVDALLQHALRTSTLLQHRLINTSAHPRQNSGAGNAKS